MPIPEVSDEELRQMAPAQARRCKCPGCPSFVAGDPSPLFCWPTVGRSSFIKEQRG
jgi:hypothetical protein